MKRVKIEIINNKKKIKIPIGQLGAFFGDVKQPRTKIRGTKNIKQSSYFIIVAKDAVNIDRNAETIQGNESISDFWSFNENKTVDITKNKVKENPNEPYSILTKLLSKNIVRVVITPTFGV